MFALHGGGGEEGGRREGRGRGQGEGEGEGGGGEYVAE